MTKKYLIYLLLVLFLVSLANAELIFTEIMYDCPGSDAKKEWIEVYNLGNEVNLTSFKLNEGEANHKLKIHSGNETILQGQFVIIADHPKTFLEEFPNFNGTVFDTSFNAGLSGKGETLILKNNSQNVIRNITYNTSIGGKGNGNTLCLIDNEWDECSPTPGRINELFIDILNESDEEIGVKNFPENISNIGNYNNDQQNKEDQKVILSENLVEDLFLGEKYTSLFKIKINDKDNCSKKDTLNFKYNISGNHFFKEDYFSKEIGCSSYASTGKFIPDKTGNYQLCTQLINSSLQLTETVSLCYDVNVIDTSNIDCDISISLNSTDKLIYDNGEKVSFKFDLNDKSYPFTIDYWIEDLFGTVFKNKVSSTNTNKKSWKTKITDKDTVLLLKGEVSPLCDDKNLSNNFIEKLLIIKNDKFSLTIDSSSTVGSEEETIINILKVSPETVAFGKIIQADIEVYKGETGKYSLGAWLEKDGIVISQKTKINLKKKYSNYKFTLPIQLKPNCNLKVPEGKAKLIIEGLDEHEEFSVDLEGVDKTLCRDYLSYVKELEKKDSTSTKSKLSHGLLNFETIKDNIYSGEEIILPIQFIGDGTQHKFKVWAYLYRGSKCYSCCADCEIVKEREDNMKLFDLSAESTKIIELPLIIDDGLDAGDYKLKIKINKDDQKTDKEITETITIKEKLVSSELEDGQNVLNTNGLNECSNPSYENINSIETKNEYAKIKEGSSGVVVYESNSEKAKKLVPTLLMITFALLSLVLAFSIFKKKS